MKNIRKLVKLAYDKCAKSYLEDRDLFKNKKYLVKLNALVKPKSKILDIGCGAGIPIDEYLVSCGYLVTGVDMSEKQIELAKKNIPTATYMVEDMSQMDFSENSFDVAVSFYAIFHIPRQEHLDLFKNIYRLLKPGGYFLVTLGSEEWEGSEAFHGVMMHWSHWGKEKNLKLIKKAGFKIIEAEVDNSGGEHHLVVMTRKE